MRVWLFVGCFLWSFDARGELLSFPPGYDVQESFESVNESTPAVSRSGGANLLTFPDLLLPSGITLDSADTYIANFAIPPPLPQMSYQTGTWDAAEDLPAGFGHSFVLGNNAVVTLRFSHLVAVAGAFVIMGASNDVLTVTAYDEEGHALGSSVASTTDGATWGASFVGWYDRQQRIAALSFTAAGGAPVLLDRAQYRTSVPVSVSSAEEPAGGHCAAGGAVIRTGADLDGDGVVSESEATDTSYVCSGINGQAGDVGPSGDDGADGVQGADGAAGPAGTNALVSVAEATACVHGGQLVSAGVDTDGDGTLDDSEVTSTVTVCNEAPPSRGGCGASAPSLFDWLLVVAFLRYRKRVATSSNIR